MGSILLLCVLNTFLAAFGFPTTELPDTNSTGHGVTTSKNIALTSSPSLENAMNNSFQMLVQNASDIEGRGCPIDLSLDFPISELMERNGFSWKNYSDGSVMLGSCTFNIFKQSFFVIHGWSLVPLPDTWIDSLVAAIFHRHPHSNVFVLNWLDLAQVRYARAVRRGHQVGRHIAAFIDWLNEQWGYLPKRIHLVGFSLGAHVAGFVGSAVSRGQIGRITGLDPAGPIFETAPPDKSLSPDDALFVDVIHTSIVGPAGLNFSMGIQRPVGHQDFYPNGGTYQPGCDWSLAYENVGKYGIMGLAQTLKCGHERAVHIFVDTLRSKYLPPAYPCSSLEEWQRGHCLKCNKSTCPLMGKEVKLNNRARRHAIHHKGLYLQTAASPPFIVYHYKVKSDMFIPYGAPLDSEPFLRISLHGSLNSAQDLPLPLYDDFSSNKSHSWLVHTSTELGDLKSVHLSWDVEDGILWRTWLAFSSYIIGDKDIGEGEKPRIMARKVHVKSGESGHRWKFCTDDSDWVIMKRFNKEKFDICHPDPATKEFQPSNETRLENLASFTRPSLWLLLFVPLSTLLTIFTSL